MSATSERSNDRARPRALEKALAPEQGLSEAWDFRRVQSSGMGLGTKNRQKQTAEVCKQHLREKYRDKLALVEEYIVEIEGTLKNCDVTRWSRCTDIKDIRKEMLKRLEIDFENWLNL